MTDNTIAETGNSDFPFAVSADAPTDVAPTTTDSPDAAPDAVPESVYTQVEHELGLDVAQVETDIRDAERTATDAASGKVMDVLNTDLPKGEADVHDTVARTHALVAEMHGVVMATSQIVDRVKPMVLELEKEFKDKGPMGIVTALMSGLKL